MKPQEKLAGPKRATKGPTARPKKKEVRQPPGRQAEGKSRKAPSSKTRAGKKAAASAAAKAKKGIAVKLKIEPVEHPKTQPPRGSLAGRPQTRARPTKTPPKTNPKSESREKTLKIPPILFEGDLPPAPKVTGPGMRYALTAQAPGSSVLTETREIPTRTELPEGYGTRRLFLTARDPRWLYASWDLTPDQQREYNRRSRDGHLILRIYAQEQPVPVVPAVHVNPESRSFFVSVPRPETRYWAELGFYSEAGRWESISKSESTFTPPDAPASEGVVEFATIPVQVTFAHVVQAVQEFVQEHQPLLEAVIAAQEAQKIEASSESAASSANGRAELHQAKRGAMRAAPQALSREGGAIPIRVERAQSWTTERKESLARLISIDSYRRVWMGSIEITEFVRRQLQEEIGSIAAAELARAAAAEGPGLGETLLGISSPPGGEMPGKKRKFWFKVNAELIIYGATEPDARVTIADRPVKLRPDGTFSFRFALPDGHYGLPAVAASADGLEAREAVLQFSRTTEYRGHVEAHPQDPALRPPRAENL